MLSAKVITHENAGGYGMRQRDDLAQGAPRVGPFADRGETLQL